MPGVQGIQIETIARLVPRSTLPNQAEGINIFIGQLVTSFRDYFLIFNCCLDSLTVRIDPTIHIHPNLERDYGLFTVEKYSDPFNNDAAVYPTNTCQSIPLTTTWTTAYD